MSIQIDKAAVIAELHRVSQILGTKHLGQRDFQKLSTISRATVTNRFGSWNNALQAAGLLPAISKRRNLPTDDDLLINIITVTHKLKKIPSGSDMISQGKHSLKPYVSRWGSFTQARDAAYQKYGMPSEAIGNSNRQVKPPQHRQKQSGQVIVGMANSLKPHLLKMKDAETRAFVEEAIKCFEAGLYRMEASRNPKWKTARTRDDLDLMKESAFLDILATLSIIGKNVKEQLKNNCLSLRNACGHPNSFKVGRSMTESHLEILLLNIYDIF